MTKLPEDMTEQDMVEMKINTTACFGDFTVMRVPGGWIYDGKQDIFVPLPSIAIAKTDSIRELGRRLMNASNIIFNGLVRVGD